MGFWEDKRVIVTGGAGFLGSYVIEKLKARGCKEIFIPHAKNYTIFREILLIADHNAYHLGQLVTLRKMMEIWH